MTTYIKKINWRIIALQYCVGFCLQHDLAVGIHMCPLPEPLFHSHPHLSRLLWSTGLSSLCYTATFHQLFILHMVLYKFQCYSLNQPHLLLPAIYKPVLYVRISISALQIGSSVLFFYIPYICIMIFIFFFLTYFILHNRLYIHPPHQN